MNDARFITIEGIEGVGKSTNVQWVASLIHELGKEVLITREPGGTALAEDLRNVLLHDYPEKMEAKTELLLLYAGRVQHVERVIKPALQSGKWVVCDRFIDATFAYQGAGRQFPIEKVERLNQWALGTFTPDYTIILDAPVELALSRIKGEKVLDRFEQEAVAFFERVRHAYLTRATQSPDTYALVDASLPLEQVQANLQKIVTTFCAGASLTC